MRAVLQRVARAEVEVDGEVVGQIGKGILALVGVGREDSEADAKLLADKTVNLRIFPDAAGRMNRSLKEVGGALLVVSQFTLLGDCRKGRRPSFVAAAAAPVAERLYHVFVDRAREHGLEVATGRFQQLMQVSLVNDGPVTLLLDSKREF